MVRRLSSQPRRIALLTLHSFRTRDRRLTRSVDYTRDSDRGLASHRLEPDAYLRRTDHSPDVSTLLATV